jgi:hypothetical protein
MTTKLKLSHDNLLALNNVEISSITTANVFQIVRNLKGLKYQEVSANYKTSILNTIKQEKMKRDPNFANIKPKDLNLHRVRNKMQFNATVISNLIKTTNYVYNYNPTGNISISRSLLDCMISILIVTATSTKTSQLNNILLQHLKELKDRGPTVEIMNKITIFAYPYIYNADFKKIILLVELRNKLFKNEILNGKYNQQQVVMVKPDALNKQFKILFVSVTLSDPPDHLGLNKYLLIQPRELLFTNISVPDELTLFDDEELFVDQ